MVGSVVLVAGPPCAAGGGLRTQRGDLHRAGGGAPEQRDAPQSRFIRYPRGQSTLWSPGTDLGTEGRSSLLPEGHEGWVQQTVETVPLDELGLSDVGFVKIDVEGFELSVIKGATGLLTRERPNVLVEIEQAHTSNEHIDNVFDVLSGLGYRGRSSATTGHGTRSRTSTANRPAVSARGGKRRDCSATRFSRKRYINNFLFTPN